MGLLLIRSASARIATDSRLVRPGVWHGFSAGVAAILGNPKAVLFYMGVLPGFFDLRTVSTPDVAAIIAASVAIPLVGNLLLAGFVGRVRTRITAPRTVRRINLVSGALLVLVGLLIALS